MRPGRTYRFAAVPEWIVFHPDLDGNAVRCFAVLDRIAGDDESAWPSLALIGERMAGSDQVARRAIRKLVEVGAVAVVERFTDGGRQTSNVYVLAGDSPMTPCPIESDSQAPIKSDSQEGVDPDTQHESQRNESHTTESHSPSRSLDIDVPDPFDAFWACYPRKVAKPEAVKAWYKIKPRQHADVMAGLSTWCAYWSARGEPEFVPHPATWLRREGWADAPPPLTKRKGSTVEQLDALQFDSAGNLIT